MDRSIMKEKFVDADQFQQMAFMDENQFWKTRAHGKVSNLRMKINNQYK